MESQKKKMTIASVQLKPVFLNIQESIKIAESVLKSQLCNNTSDLDAIVFPEANLSGYCIDNFDDLCSVSEIQGSGPQFEFYKEIALRYNSYVFAGYYERMTESEQQKKEGI